MIDLANVVDHGCLIIYDFVTDIFVLQIPIIDGILIGGNPLSKQGQIENLIPIIPGYNLLSFIAVTGLPKCYSDSVYYCA